MHRTAPATQAGRSQTRRLSGCPMGRAPEQSLAEMRQKRRASLGQNYDVEAMEASTGSQTKRIPESLVAMKRRASLGKKYNAEALVTPVRKKPSDKLWQSEHHRVSPSSSNLQHRSPQQRKEAETQKEEREEESLDEVLLLSRLCQGVVEMVEEKTKEGKKEEEKYNNKVSQRLSRHKSLPMQPARRRTSLAHDPMTTSPRTPKTKKQPLRRIKTLPLRNSKPMPKLSDYENPWGSIDDYDLQTPVKQSSRSNKKSSPTKKSKSSAQANIEAYCTPKRGSPQKAKSSVLSGITSFCTPTRKKVPAVSYKLADSHTTLSSITISLGDGAIDYSSLKNNDKKPNAPQRTKSSKESNIAGSIDQDETPSPGKVDRFLTKKAKSFKEEKIPRMPKRCISLNSRALEKSIPSQSLTVIPSRGGSWREEVVEKGILQRVVTDFSRG